MATVAHRAALALLVLAATSGVVATRADVTVFAAASLKNALDEQARRFEARSGDKVTAVYAASNALARQIEAGAPADIFISADIDWMDYLDQRQRVAAGTSVALLKNALVLIAPAASRVSLRIAPKFDLAAALSGGRLALANPDAVPAGKYARSSLEALGVWSNVEKQLARTENVRAALALVSRAEAPLGIVYRSDALADRGVRIVDTFPAATHAPIVYPAAVLADSRSPAARPLLEYLRSADARATWEKYGFEAAR